MRFKEASPGRSSEPRRSALWACARVKPSDRTMVLALVRFAISTCTVRYGRYIHVRQVAGTRTTRYRAVPPKIDRWRSISIVDD
ncbi:hypothetical protein BHM03_00042733 [Ensete ventricosum]|nr:hypothetical protein BHM03_00042733 [Ensete ventricosum]